MRSFCTLCILEQGLSPGKPSIPYLAFTPTGARARSVPGARRGFGVGRPYSGRTPAFRHLAARRGWFPKGFTLAPVGFKKSFPFSYAWRWFR